MSDFAKEVFMEKIDSQFSKFGESKLRKDLGLPEREVKLTENDIVKKAFAKLERENAWIEANTFTVKDRSDSRNRHHGKQNAKKRNKKLNKTKGKSSLYLAKRPENAGTRCVLSSRWSEHNKTFHKEWYPDTNKGMEQNKVSARELKKYFDSLVEDEAREKEFLEEYYEDINDVSLEELVDEYLQLKAKGYSVYKDRFKFCTNRNQLLDLMTITDDDDYDPFSEDDYDSEYVSLHSLIYAMKKKEDKVKPLFEVVKVISEEYGYEVNVATERIPAWFDITEMKGGIFVREEYDSLHHEEMYIFYTETKRNEIIPLFEVTRNLSSNRYLGSLLRELDTEFLIKLDEYR